MGLLGSFLFNYVAHPTRPSLDETIVIEKEKGFWGDFDSCAAEEMNITCRDGYVLHGNYIPGTGNKFVIVTHGYSYNRHGSIKYANVFRKLGYHVYLYDLRYHGANEKTFCSMGYNESRDIIDVAKALYDRFGTDITIGLHGESLGAASSMLACGMMDSLPKPFSFLVEDCGFADLNVLLEDLIGIIMHLPRSWSHKASDASMKKHGYRMDEIKPFEGISSLTDMPILFIHGADDDFILPKHCHMLYDAYQGPKQLYLCPSAKHAQSYEVDGDTYFNIVKEFLVKHGDSNPR